MNATTVETLAGKPKLLDRVRHAIRVRHLAQSTEKAYDRRSWLCGFCQRAQDVSAAGDGRTIVWDVRVRLPAAVLACQADLAFSTNLRELIRPAFGSANSYQLPAGVLSAHLPDTTLEIPSRNQRSGITIRYVQRVGLACYLAASQECCGRAILPELQQHRASGQRIK